MKKIMMAAIILATMMTLACSMEVDSYHAEEPYVDYYTSNWSYTADWNRSSSLTFLHYYNFLVNNENIEMKTFDEEVRFLYVMQDVLSKVTFEDENPMSSIHWITGSIILSTREWMSNGMYNTIERESWSFIQLGSLAYFWRTIK